MRYILPAFFILAIFATPVQSADSDILKPNHFPSLISSIRINASLDFCGEPLDLDNSDIRERLEKEMLLILWNRAQIVLWIKRSGRYFPIIEKMLKEHNMPEDLKYVPIVESALLPHIGSDKGALGYWQFIKTTGRRYGLEINSRKDERRNIFPSTRAAIAYFKKLHGTFGSWSLAAAAYNMGGKGLQTQVLLQNTKNYYQLYLPLETQRYVLRIVAVKIILSNLENYGFRLAKEDLYPPLQFDRIMIKSSQQTPVALIAQAAKTQYKVIKDLNPEIRGRSLAAGNHWIMIPKGKTPGFQSLLKKNRKQWVKIKPKGIYVVKKGDNLSMISKRFNIPLSTLLARNRLKKNKPIHPGDRLVVSSD